MQVVVKVRDVQEKRGTSAKSGKPYLIRYQEGWVSLDGETRRLKIGLADENPGYAPGLYEVDDKSFFVDQYSELSLGKLVLRQVPAQAVARG